MKLNLGCGYRKLDGYVNIDNREDIGGFRDVGRGVLGVDWDFSQRLHEAGWKLGVLSGLYIYHFCGMRKLGWRE